ncbi:MAG: hypothetical protein ACOWWM_09455 [Desulfobacterales bacterium]
MFSRSLSVMVCMAAALLAAACVSHVDVTPRPEVKGDERLLVLPFVDMAMLHGENAVVRSPVTGKVFETGPVEEDASGVLNEHLLSQVRSRTGFNPVPVTEAGDLLASLRDMRESGQSEIRALVSAGRSARADLVMAGYLYRFKRRIGGNFSVESPASVAFELHLIQVEDGQVLWTGTFDETQKSLSENLMELGTFIRRGAKWVTAEQLALPAIDDMISTLVSP